MKKIGLFVIVLLFAGNGYFAQKVGYVDTDYILSNIPEYKAAQTELDKASVDWQKEIEIKYDDGEEEKPKDMTVTKNILQLIEELLMEIVNVCKKL